MKFLKGVFTTLGLLGVIGAVVLVFVDWFKIKSLWMVANANRSTSFPNPWYWVLATLGAAAVGFFLLGLGLGLPSLRAGNSRKQAVTANRGQDANAPVIGNDVSNADVNRNDTLR